MQSKYGYSSNGINPNPSQLLNKISSMKSSSQLLNKQHKILIENLQFYEQYSLSSIEQCTQKLQHLNFSLNQIKKINKQSQSETIDKLTIFESKLEQILGQYEKKRRKGEEMINQMIEKIQLQLEQKVIKMQNENSIKVEILLRIYQRTQSIVKTVESMQAQLENKYQKLRMQIKQKMQYIQQNIQHEIRQIQNKHEKMLRKLQDIEQKVEDELGKLNKKKEEKRIEMHELIENIIREIH